MKPVLSVRSEGYRPHPLHSLTRTWTETSCHVDVWIEVLHSLDLDPTAALGFTLSAELVGDQWRFLKLPSEDLRLLFGIQVDEVILWRSLSEHVEYLLSVGRLPVMEADVWFLPDTVGSSYHHEHAKSTIVPNLIDLDAKRLEYFHNTGYHELSGTDFDGLFSTSSLPPYIEAARLDRLDRSDPRARAARVALSHLDRRPTENPVTSLGRMLENFLPHLAGGDAEKFHDFAFSTVRQCGANAELAASFARGLNGDPTFFDLVAAHAKSLQLKLARVVRGRAVSVTDLIATMARNWADGMDTIQRQLAGRPS